jgi:CheY-like chemotaxis protein
MQRKIAESFLFRMKRAKHILLVDDNDVDNFIAEQMLQIRNVAEHITVKKSASSALDFLQKQAAQLNPFPDYIFLDLNMPVMDGYAFLKEYSKFPEPLKAKSNIIILTSSEDPKDKDKAEHNPLVKKFLQKPLTLKNIDDVIPK